MRLQIFLWHILTYSSVVHIQTRSNYHPLCSTQGPYLEYCMQCGTHDQVRHWQRGLSSLEGHGNDHGVGALRGRKGWGLGTVQMLWLQSVTAFQHLQNCCWDGKARIFVVVCTSRMHDKGHDKCETNFRLDKRKCFFTIRTIKWWVR